MINETSCKSPHHTDNKKFVRRIIETTEKLPGIQQVNIFFATATIVVVVEYFEIEID